MELNLKIIIYQIIENQQPIINQCILINNKELTEEETQKFTLKDPKNKILNLHKDSREFFRTYYHVRVVLNNPIDPMFNCIEFTSNDKV
jgi:hypothetical protein